MVDIRHCWAGDLGFWYFCDHLMMGLTGFANMVMDIGYG